MQGFQPDPLQRFDTFVTALSVSHQPREQPGPVTIHTPSGSCLDTSAAFAVQQAAVRRKWRTGAIIRAYKTKGEAVSSSHSAHIVLIVCLLEEVLEVLSVAGLFFFPKRRRA